MNSFLIHATKIEHFLVDFRFVLFDFLTFIQQQQKEV
jgi:hypothetical protein